MASRLVRPSTAALRDTAAQHYLKLHTIDAVAKHMGLSITYTSRLIRRGLALRPGQKLWRLLRDG